MEDVNELKLEEVALIQHFSCVGRNRGTCNVVYKVSYSKHVVQNAREMVCFLRAGHFLTSERSNQDMIAATVGNEL